jgi:hypothetical protein
MKKKPVSTQRFALKENDRIVLDNRTKNRIAIETRKDADGQFEVIITILDETESETGN